MEAERNEKIFNSITKVIDTYSSSKSQNAANTSKMNALESSLAEDVDFEEEGGGDEYEYEDLNEDDLGEEEEDDEEVGEQNTLIRPEDSNKLLLQCRNKINLKLLEGGGGNKKEEDSTKVLIILPGGKQQIIPLNVLDGMKDVSGSFVGSLRNNKSCENCGDNCQKCNKENLNMKKSKIVKKKKEPEVLVLSSDDDEDESENEDGEPEPQANDDELEEYSGGIAEYIMENKQSGNFTTLECRWVRIGSYKAKPKERILVSSSSLVMVVPSTETHTPVLINIAKNEILKFVTHFGKKVQVIFMFVIPTTATKIRKSLQMTDDSGPYFDPSSKNETHRRITFILEKMTDDKKGHLEVIFDNNVYCEISESDAKQILMRACQSNEVEQVKKILVYPPPPEKGGISINNQDYCCLADDQFLNDVIIDFYLKYLLINLLSEEDKVKTHVFSTFFFKRLTSSSKNQADKSLSLSEKRHSNVEKWTKNVNLFEKDFIIIPINEESHWFLGIICFPGLFTVEEYEDGEKQPLILIFDSLLESDHNKTITILRSYLEVEYNKKIGGSRKFDDNTFKGVILNVPQQNNFTDCGVFVLEYAEQFFKKPIKSFSVPFEDLSDWFDISTIPKKRREIAQLITDLITEDGVEVYELGLPSLFCDDDDEDGLEDEEWEEDEEQLQEEEEVEEGQITDCQQMYRVCENNDDSFKTLESCRQLSPVLKKRKVSSAN